jgi:4-carboxymuconolactone decarboxylase
VAIRLRQLHVHTQQTIVGSLGARALARHVQRLGARLARGIGDPMASLISLLSIAIATHARGDRHMPQKKPTVYEFIPKLGQLRDDVLFGDVWEHPDLSKRDRSLITVAMLAALYRTDEMRGHMQRALDNGVTETELKGLITHVAFYAGWPCAVNAGRVAIDVFGPK